MSAIDRALQQLGVECGPTCYCRTLLAASLDEQQQMLVLRIAAHKSAQLSRTVAQGAEELAESFEDDVDALTGHPFGESGEEPGMEDEFHFEAGSMPDDFPPLVARPSDGFDPLRFSTHLHRRSRSGTEPGDGLNLRPEERKPFLQVVGVMEGRHLSGARCRPSSDVVRLANRLGFGRNRRDAPAARTPGLHPGLEALLERVMSTLRHGEALQSR